MVADTIKINQLAFVKDLIIKERLINCNANIISIKSISAIEI